MAMRCVSDPGSVSPNSNPSYVYVYAEDSTSHDGPWIDGPRNLPIGQTMLKESKVPRNLGTRAKAHAHITQYQGSVSLYAQACVDDTVKGAYAYAYASVPAKWVEAEATSVAFQFGAMALPAAPGVESFARWRFVLAQPDQFDRRGIPGGTDSPDAPLVRLSQVQTPVVVPDDQVLYDLWVRVDANGLQVTPGGEFRRPDNVLTTEDFRPPRATRSASSSGGRYMLKADAQRLRTLEVPAGDPHTIVLVQWTWGIALGPIVLS